MSSTLLAITCAAIALLWWAATWPHAVIVTGPIPPHFKLSMIGTAVGLMFLLGQFPQS